MKINVTYIPNTRRLVDALHIDHVWRYDGLHLRAVTVFRRKLIDITDIPF